MLTFKAGPQSVAMPTGSYQWAIIDDDFNQSCVIEVQIRGPVEMLRFGTEIWAYEGMPIRVATREVMVPKGRVPCATIDADSMAGLLRELRADAGVNVDDLARGFWRFYRMLEAQREAEAKR